MLTPTQTERLNRVFAVFDMDGNGGISWDDFETVAGGIADEFGLDLDSAEVKGLLAAYKNVWDYVGEGADLDQDGRVLKAEFVEAHSAQRLSVGELLNRWQVVADRCFDIADRDADGYIDEDAVAGIYRGAGIADGQVARIAFEAMDVDSNGQVDRTEFSANVRGLFIATDESMKGARMLGGT